MSIKASFEQPNQTKFLAEMDPLALPATRSWAEGFEKPISVWDVASMRGGLEMATVFSKLFWPEFEIISGVVVLSEGISSAGLASWKETTIKGGGRGVWDRIHVYDLFLNESVKFADEVWAYLAEILQQTWQACLNLRFPEAEANVELSFSDQDYGPTLSIDQLIR